MRKPIKLRKCFLIKEKSFYNFCISLNTKIVSFNAMCDAAIRIAFFFSSAEERDFVEAY